MPRAISMRHTAVPLAEKTEFRERARQTLAHDSKHGCNYWLFEEATLPGAYVEFVEAKDRATLQHAHTAAPVPVLESARLYIQVELN